MTNQLQEKSTWENFQASDKEVAHRRKIVAQREQELLAAARSAMLTPPAESNLLEADVQLSDALQVRDRWLTKLREEEQ